jgi:hypothetical protein
VRVEQFNFHASELRERLSAFILFFFERVITLSCSTRNLEQDESEPEDFIFLKYGFGDQAMRRMAEKNRSLQLRGTESTLLHWLVWVSTNPH